MSSDRLHAAADSVKYRHPQKTGDGVWGLLWKNRRKDCGPKGNRNSKGRPTDLDPWGSQSLNYQPKNIHRLNLGLPAQIHQMINMVFLWVLKNSSWAYPKTLHIRYVLLD